MARTAIFGNRADKNETPDDADARTEELSSETRTEELSSETRTEELAGTPDHTLEERVSEDRAVPKRIAVEQDRTFAKRIPVDEEPVGPGSPASEVAPEVAPEPVVETVVPSKPARVSLFATLGLVVGVAAAAATFTGRLAWVGVAAGIIAILISLAGVAAGARPHVAGRGLGMLGVLFGVAAVAFGIVAMTHSVSWLDSNVDTVGQIRHWFDTQLAFTKSW